MRKIVLSVVASCALVAFVPASALAHGHHHKRHHRGHHARIHHRTFGHDWGQSGANTSSEENAGTVQSFTNGVLTIALNDGSTVSGKVTDATEIECRAPETSSGMRSHERGDENRFGENENENENCDSAALTPGTVVHEAALRVSSAGAVWDKVELVSASAADNDNDDD